ncbi:MAG: NADP-dependent malic enzyme [Myxococcales bacterium]|nr:NADP-dependent malic enzyme [Myxococcales bacterium]
MAKVRRKEALEYHVQGRPGKIEVVPTKPLTSQRDLSLAYSPGVAEPCLAIKEDPRAAYEYTARGNLVAVISNGTAVLGLGNLGPLAAKPVMEGKGVLFKKFADIDVFDLEIDATDPERFVDVVAALEPTFGGINLEDIKAPESFYIEEALKKRMNIPVFHDDQHGTAIISGAALINAAYLQDKRIEDLKVVVSGAGASAVACARFFISLGVHAENLLMVDSTGVIFEGRTERMNEIKAQFLRKTEARTLADAMKGADVLLGLSVGGLVTPAMVETMAERPIIFALANPDPEIPYEEAKLARPDAIVATGRSDTNNQVNNVLGFPFIFRGALDVRATAINEQMKVAAAHAIADLARRDVPRVVNLAYGSEFSFGPDYIIPKPFDPRVLYWVAPAVAKAAVASGVAGIESFDESAYREHLRTLLGQSSTVIRRFIRQASNAPQRIVFPEGDDPRILQACSILLDEGVAQPLLLGSPERIRQLVAEHEIDLDLSAVELVDPTTDSCLADYVEHYYAARQRKGIDRKEADRRMRWRNHFGMMMVLRGRAEGIVSGINAHYPEVIRPALQILGLAPGVRRTAGMYLVLHHQRGMLLFADTTVSLEIDAEVMADVGEMVADAAKTYDLTPRVAMLSLSSFGSTRHPEVDKVVEATRILRKRRPELEVEGEIQANVALDYALQRRTFPFSRLTGPANVLVFPNLDAGNIAYKLMRELGNQVVVGPVLLGMAHPVTVLERDCDVDSIVLMTALTVVQAQERRLRDAAAQ